MTLPPMTIDDEELSVETPALRPPLQYTDAPRDNEPPGGLDKLMRWQEERLARRARGEYESAVLHLADLINSNVDKPARITSVRVEGAARTRQSFLASLIEPRLQAAGSGPQTFGTALHTTRNITHILSQTDNFHFVAPRLEASRNIFARDGDLELVLRTREKSWLFAKTSTEVGNSEATAGATVRLRNVFGGAETLEANLSAGTKTRRSFQSTLAAPLAVLDPTLRTQGLLSVFNLQRDNSSYSSSSEESHGIKAAVTTSALGRGQHEFAYNAVLRHVGDLTESASLSMRLAAGPSVKSSLSHSWVCDTRDDPTGISGTNGAYTKLSHELAGLGGDAGFYKAEGETRLTRALAPGTHLSFSARAGSLFPLFGARSHFPDRFQLGGPLSVRMFRANSLGPRDGIDSLGGDLYWGAGLSVITDVPRKAHWPIKFQAFVNAGRLDARDPSKSVAENVAASLSRPSVSAGVGILYKFDWIRVEANFGVPLAASKSDGFRKGFQVGMGVDFL